MLCINYLTTGITHPVLGPARCAFLAHLGNFYPRKFDYLPNSSASVLEGMRKSLIFIRTRLNCFVFTGLVQRNFV